MSNSHQSNTKCDHQALSHSCCYTLCAFNSEEATGTKRQHVRNKVPAALPRGVTTPAGGDGFSATTITTKRHKTSENIQINTPNGFIAKDLSLKVHFSNTSGPSSRRSRLKTTNELHTQEKGGAGGSN